jgi:hypothetical protein
MYYWTDIDIALLAIDGGWLDIDNKLKTIYIFFFFAFEVW